MIVGSRIWKAAQPTKAFADFEDEVMEALQGVGLYPGGLQSDIWVSEKEVVSCRAIRSDG